MTSFAVYYNILAEYLLEDNVLNKKTVSLLLAVVMLFTFSGCEFFDKLYDMHLNSEKNKSQSSSQESVPEPVIINTGWPVTVCETEISAEPKSVAAVSPAIAEYISDLGLFDRLCAVGSFCTFDESASALPDIGTVLLPNFDVIKSAAPEYILSFSQYDEASLIKLQQMNITVLVFSAPTTIEELRSLYCELAVFFLGSEEGATFGDTFIQKYNSALEEISYSGTKISAGFLRGMDNIMITSDSLGGTLLSACFTNAAGDATGFEYPVDSLGDFNPDILFVSGTVRLKHLESSDLYRKKSAVKNDLVFLADLDAVNIGSLRSIGIIKDMMTTAYDDFTDGTNLEIAYPSIYQ